jgi:hypothetical protein
MGTFSGSGDCAAASGEWPSMPIAATTPIAQKRLITRDGTIVFLAVWSPACPGATFFMCISLSGQSRFPFGT